MIPSFPIFNYTLGILFCFSNNLFIYLRMVNHESNGLLIEKTPNSVNLVGLKYKLNRAENIPSTKR